MAYQASKGMHFLHSSGTALPTPSFFLRFRSLSDLVLAMKMTWW
jgi:hypothetical protein